MKLSLRALAALAIFPLAACASPPPHAVDWRAESHALTYPEGYERLCVREVSVHEIAPGTTADRTLPEERYAVSEKAARKVVVKALAGLGIFRGVDDGLPDHSSGNVIFETGLVLDLALENTALVHTGENDQATKAFWLWLLTGLPGHAVRDQLYEIACEPLFQVSDGATGEVLVPWQPLAAPDVGPWALNFHERTTGVSPYLLSNVCPPSSISIDPEEVTRQILPATLRPSLASLAETFREISFLPSSKLRIARHQAAGIHVDDAIVPKETRNDKVELTLVLALEKGPASLKEVKVGGATRIDFTKGSAAPLVHDGKLELKLDVDVPPGESVDVEVVLEGAPGPEKIVTISAEKGALRPEWHR